MADMRKAQKTTPIDDTRGAARADAHPRYTHTQDVLVDARGFTYTSVRFCDLDRIRDK